jgi:hypothetical protein
MHKESETKLTTLSVKPFCAWSDVAALALFENRLAMTTSACVVFVNGSVEYDAVLV